MYAKYNFYKFSKDKYDKDDDDEFMKIVIVLNVNLFLVFLKTNIQKL